MLELSDTNLRRYVASVLLVNYLMGSIPAFAQVGIKLLGDSLDTANDLSLTATQIKAAGDASLTAGEALTLKAVDLQADRNFELSSVGNAAIVSDATTAANGSITQATSRIKAGNQANVTALGDLAVQGGDVQAKDINLTALGDVTLTGVQNKAVSGGGNDTTTVTTTQSLNLKGDNINIQGVGQRSDVTLVAANVDAANKAKIAGSGNVTISTNSARRCTRQRPSVISWSWSLCSSNTAKSKKPRASDAHVATSITVGCNHAAVLRRQLRRRNEVGFKTLTEIFKYLRQQACSECR